MQYRRLGKSGLLVSEVSFGSWVTFGDQLGVDSASACMKMAFDKGINFFDNAEGYGDGQAEIIMGQALKDFPREELVISTKLFWGGSKPNQTGLSRKHIIEGTRNSLKRLQLDYVDLLFCHRPDPNTPIEETVLAMDSVVRSGQALYWGTSEWSADEIRKAFHVAKELHCVPPTMEQPQYNMFTREKVEVEFLPLYEKYGLGTTIWSPLASGLLTGKYRNGIPTGSRLEKLPWLKDIVIKNHLLSDESHERMEKLERLAKEIGASLSQLAIAWCLKNKYVSTVILGASKTQQLEENLKSVEIAAQIDAEFIVRIDDIISGWRR